MSPSSSLLHKIAKKLHLSRSDIRYKRFDGDNHRCNGRSHHLSDDDDKEGDNDSVCVPKGCVAIYVGHDRQKFAVRLEYLEEESLQKMIKESQGDDLERKIDGPFELENVDAGVFDAWLKDMAKRSRV